jgi:hypothetical protein
VTPFSLFDEDEDEEDHPASSTRHSQVSRPAVTVPRPSALLSESLVIDEINLIPTDPT